MNFLWSLWYKFQEWRYERKCLKHLGIKPSVIYVSKEAYDKLIDAINQPPDTKVVERLKEIMSKPAPWEEE